MGESIPSWQSLAAAKRQAILDSIPNNWRLASIPSVEEQRDVTGTYVQQHLSPREIEITETDAVGIVEKTSSGQWTSVEVAEAFCHRASLGHQLLNCLHETFFEAALADAKELDVYFAQHKQPKGPLHGLPVSLKDQFHVKDVETTMGYVGWIDTFQGLKGDERSKVFESEMVRELRQLGAVLYCKTSVPHTLMSGETANNIIGYTWNPKNRNLCSGGSSGGEGALIAFHGSPGGFGTDIGGSIRIPAAFCGLFGLRPTIGRLPYEGMANSMDGQNTVLSVVGPLASSAGGVKLLTKAILSAEPWLYDPYVTEMPWRSDVEAQTKDYLDSSQLAIGILDHDGRVGVHPPLKRALKMLGDVFSKAGHKVIDWQPPDHSVIVDLVSKTWTYDGGEDVLKDFKLSGEPWVPQVDVVAKSQPQATASDIAAVNRQLREKRKEYLDYWNSTKSATGTGRPVDAFVSPCAPFTAALKSKYDYYGYSMYVNGLDLPGIVIPITTADRAIDVPDASYQPVSELDKKIQDYYDPEIYHGAPVALQLVGRRFQEEKLLAIAEWFGGHINGIQPSRCSETLSLVPTASSRLLWAIEKSPAWAWLFRHPEDHGNNKFNEVQRLFQAINSISWLWSRRPAAQMETSRDHSNVHRVVSPNPVADPSARSNPYVANLRQNFLCLFLDLLPGGQNHHVITFTEAQFEAVSIFLPKDVLTRMAHSSPEPPTPSANPWSTYLAEAVPMDHIEKRTQEILLRKWTPDDALRFVPFLTQAYVYLLEAKSAELNRLANLHRNYPRLLKTPFAPQEPRNNPKHISDALSYDAKRTLTKPLHTWSNYSREWYRFRHPHPALVPYDWCFKLFRLVTEKHPISLSSRYPPEPQADLRRSMEGFLFIRQHDGTRRYFQRTHGSSNYALPHSPAELDWLESFVRCVDWMQANHSDLGIDIRDYDLQSVSIRSSVSPKVLLSPDDYQEFIRNEPVRVIVKQLQSDSAICDDPSSDQLPSLLALYLPPFSDRRARAIAQRLIRNTDTSLQQFAYEDLVRKLKFSIHKSPAPTAHADGHYLAFEATSAGTASDESPEATGGHSWEESVRQLRASKAASITQVQRLCYICRFEIRKAHKTVRSMCEPCGEFNLAGSNLSLPQNLDLNGKVALVTGARVNLGYHTVLRLLRCGARIIASTRYPEDAFSRYQDEADFHIWNDRLKIVGADFRAAVDAFNLVEQTRAIVDGWGGRLHILINNAAQTLTDGVRKENSAVLRERLLCESNGSRLAIVQHSYTPRVRGVVSGGHLIESMEIKTDNNQLNPGENNGKDARIHELSTDTNSEVVSRLSDLQVGPQASGPSSWVQSLSDIPYEDVVSAQSVNTIVPLILIRELLPLMQFKESNHKSKRPSAYIVNVSSREGIFESSNKSGAKNGKHVHTNISKAGLNMITETEAEITWKRWRVAMNTVDPGYMSAAPEYEDAHGGERPIGWEDGAGRVLWPIAIGESEKMEPVWGRFLKHYGACRVDVRWGRG
ncbi:hypothetical protein SCUP515_00354 [Seiridium cupressi]